MYSSRCHQAFLGVVSVQAASLHIVKLEVDLMITGTEPEFMLMSPTMIYQGLHYGKKEPGET